MGRKVLYNMYRDGGQESWKVAEQYVYEMQVQWVGKYCTICTEMDGK